VGKREIEAPGVIAGHKEVWRRPGSLGERAGARWCIPEIALSYQEQAKPKPGGGRCATDSRSRAACTSGSTSGSTGPDFADASLQQARAWQNQSSPFTLPGGAGAAQPNLHGHHCATLLRLLLVARFPSSGLPLAWRVSHSRYTPFSLAPSPPPWPPEPTFFVDHIPVPCALSFWTI
jgi:hypothetical protein